MSWNQLTNLYVTGEWRTEFQYDAFGRRRVRKEYQWNAGTSIWDLTNEVRYVYDGLLVLQERDANNLPQVTYTRGTDLSGRLQQAGGTGGLLARTDHTPLTPQLSTALYHADGNGNITAMVSTNGYVVAKYRYDPYGNTIAAAGPLAVDNLYRFSSKEWHANSSLYYYGYRFYDPNLQRWVNRDPIEELGGYNLYEFVGNDSISRADILGLIPPTDLRWWPPKHPDPRPRPPIPTPPDKDETPKQPGPIDGACDTIKDNAPEVIKESLRERAEEQIGRRGPMPGSTAIGVAGAIGNAAVEVGMGLGQVGPGVTQNFFMGRENNRVKTADGDAFWEALERREKMAERCQDVSKKIDP